MTIQIINPIEYPNWDELILSNDQSRYSHTSAWIKVLLETYNYKPLFFTLIENGRLIDLLPIMQIKSYLTGSRGVSLPFSDQCPLITKNLSSFNTIFKDVIKYGKKASWKTIYLKGGNKCLSDSILPVETFLTHNLYLTKNEEEIFSSFRNSTKRNIKFAIKKNVRVKIQNTLKSIEEYYRLHCITRKRHGLPPQPFNFFKKSYEHIISKKKGAVALASYNNKIIAGAVFFQFNKNAIFKFGGSDSSHHNLRPNNLVMWEAIRWYCNKGYNTFNFGRTELKNKGLIQFKKGWGTTEKRINYYKYDLIKDCYVNNKSNIKSYSNLFKIIPEPFFRIAGNIFYRHIG